MSDSFADRLEKVEQRIAAACEKAGRARDEVTLLAVSKTNPAEAVREAAECGLAALWRKQGSGGADQGLHVPSRTGVAPDRPSSK